MSTPKELSYFWRDDWLEQRAWYEAKFDAPDSAIRVRGESTPFYAAYPFRRNVPERMHQLIPDAKLIYLVRDPIDRLISHWVQRVSDGDRVPFERYMMEYDVPENKIVCPSRYWLQLEQFMKVFDRSQLLVIDQHALKVRRSETLRQVFHFIEVDEHFESPGFDVEVNTRDIKTAPGRVGARFWDQALRPLGRVAPDRVRDFVRRPVTRLMYRHIKEPVLTADMRERLRVLFAPEVEALRRFTGEEFATWSL